MQRGMAHLCSLYKNLPQKRDNVGRWEVKNGLSCGLQPLTGKQEQKGYLVSPKVPPQSKNHVTRDREGHYTTKRGQSTEKTQQSQNMYATNNGDGTRAVKLTGRKET